MILSVDNWTIHWPELPSQVLVLSKNLTSSDTPSEQTIVTSLSSQTSQGDENMSFYNQLVDRLCDQVEGADLH